MFVTVFSSFFIFRYFASREIWGSLIILFVAKFVGQNLELSKMFLYNVSGVEYTPVFRWGFVFRTTVIYVFIYLFLVVLPWPGFEPTNFYVRQLFGLLVRNSSH